MSQEVKVKKLPPLEHKPEPKPDSKPEVKPQKAVKMREEIDLKFKAIKYEKT